MGIKLLWLGLTILLTEKLFIIIPAANVVGGILMWIGVVLFLFDK